MGGVQAGTAHDLNVPWTSCSSSSFWPPAPAGGVMRALVATPFGRRGFPPRNRSIFPRRRTTGCAASGDGYVHDTPNFEAHVARDGVVSFKDKHASVAGLFFPIGCAQESAAPQGPHPGEHAARPSRQAPAVSFSASAGRAATAVAKHHRLERHLPARSHLRQATGSDLASSPGELRLDRRDHARLRTGSIRAREGAVLVGHLRVPHSSWPSRRARPT